MNKYIFITFFCLPHFAIAQYSDIYQAAKDSLTNMISGKAHPSFKKAVFLTENAYFDNALSESEYLRAITLLSTLAKEVKNSIENPDYTKKDRKNLETWFSIFKVFTDTVSILTQERDLVNWMPFTYDFDDIFGKNDWSKMFVTKLMGTKKGNCHSIPYLYKIICDELSVPCHLALAPNHVYIKHRAEKGGWYNTELTSATFPIDAWLMASGYISLQAVQNGIYLDTLSEKESIALCVLDLAQGYNHKYPDNDGKFVIECCDLALKHFPDYVNAILLKAETRLKQLQAMQKEMKYAYLKEVTAMPEGKAKWDEMNSLYMQLYKLGYRQMPEQMYVEWLTSLKTEKEKYSNKSAPGAAKD